MGGGTSKKAAEGQDDAPPPQAAGQSEAARVTNKIQAQMQVASLTCLPPCRAANDRAAHLQHSALSFD
eukprot:2916881-Rhodomonas_salina.1